VNDVDVSVHVVGWLVRLLNRHSVVGDTDVEGSSRLKEATTPLPV
jgi:hypothetical protein